VQQPDPADLASSNAHGDRQRGQQVCFASIGRAWEHTTVTKPWQKQSDEVLGLAGQPSRRSRPEGLVRAAARTTAPGTTCAALAAMAQVQASRADWTDLMMA